MPRIQHQPQIIVEETEEDFNEEDDDVPTPLRKSDTFPYKRRNSPYFKLGDENLGSLEVCESYAPIPSPTPSVTSTISKHEFNVFRLTDEIMKGMMEINIISDKKICKSSKYVNTTTMVNYTVIEWNLKPTQDEKENEKISTILENWCHVRHRRIARIYGYYWKLPSQVLIFRTHVPSGTIADKLSKGALPEQQALKYTIQILDALAYLHDRKLVHGKLTTSNLLITISNDILLSDPHIPGLPCTLKRGALLNSPPEAFKTKDDFPCFTSAADVWAVGSLLISMVTRCAPFASHFYKFHGEELHKELMNQWSRNNLQFTSLTLAATASKEITDLIDTIFITRPENRPSAAMLLETFGPKSRKTSMRTSLASLVANNRVEHTKISVEEDLEKSENEEKKGQKDENDQLEELRQKHRNEGFTAFFIWYLSRLLIFSILMIKWVGMVMCAALSLALVSGSVFLSIFIIYNGIQVVCGCSLNEGFIVLIALILLPIIILLTTLCCNNSLEKYHNDVESGKVERSKYVMKTPEKDVILGGYIVIEGKPGFENVRKHGITEGMAQMLNRGDFLSGVARIA